MTKSEKQPRIAKTISQPTLKPFHRESCGGWDFPFKRPICSLPVCVRESVGDKVILRGCFVCWILEFLSSATAPRVPFFFFLNSASWNSRVVPKVPVYNSWSRRLEWSRDEIPFSGWMQWRETVRVSVSKQHWIKSRCTCMEVIIVPPDIDSSPGFDVWRYTSKRSIWGKLHVSSLLSCRCKLLNLMKLTLNVEFCFGFFTVMTCIFLY